MPITIVCPTYGRPRGVEETIACFLSQTVNDTQLLIVNDHPMQKLIYSHPRVTVINEPVRYPSLGEKRQAITEKLPSGLWTTWDDDDIYLPGYLADSMAIMSMFKTACSKHYMHWIDSGHALYRISPAAWMNTVLCDRDLFLRDGGFEPGTNNSCVPAIMALLRNKHFIGPANPPLIPPTFIYRFGNGRSHCCNMPEEQARDLVHAAADPILGDITLSPHFADDYVAKAAASWEALP